MTVTFTQQQASASVVAEQRAVDVHERARLGGVFYLLSWLLLAGFAGVWRTYPTVSVALVVAFFLLMLMRAILRHWALRSPPHRVVSMYAQWAVLLVTACLWGSVSCWTLLDAAFVKVHTITYLSTLALAMAFAQILAVNRLLCMLGTGMLILPMLGAVALAGTTDVACVLLLTLIYLVAVIGRSYREYEGKLTLDRALREQRDRFEQQSRTDALTGLANRGHFQKALEAQVESSRADGGPLVLLIADLDHFKSINDRYGHAAGDRCLREVAAILTSSFVGEDVLVARIGGEEFGVIFVGSELAKAVSLGERFRALVASISLRVEQGEPVGFTVSLGLALFKQEAHGHSDALYAAADEALYRAKAGGRNMLVAA